jgi:hypothetical protein
MDSRWSQILHVILSTAVGIVVFCITSFFITLCISNFAWVITDRFCTPCSITSPFFAFQYPCTHSRNICGRKVLLS